MNPAGLLARRGPDLARRGPEAQRAGAHRYHRRGHPAPLEVAQQRLPALGTLPVAILDREQLLLAVGPRADHDQGAEPVVFEPDIEVHPVDPDVTYSRPARSRWRKAVYSFSQVAVSRLMLVGDRPAAASPSKPSSAGRKSPVESPRR